MNNWLVKDKIKRGFINFNIGDEVICFNRKQNGHPRGIKDNIIYTIKNMDPDGHLHVAMRSNDGIGWMQTIRVHKTYMINKSELRNIKLNYLFDETK